jgi:2-polyprenyl-6-methoxyphenol hydroxylase-like FAD-dependent oxidoreductase
VAIVEKANFPRRKVCGEFVSSANLALFRQLGMADDFLERAGPPVRQVGLFARETLLMAPMPGQRRPNPDWGRALGRETLDTLLLQRAAAAGARVWQPWSAVRLDKQGEAVVCQAVNRVTRETKALRARVIIAAHGSWECGTLPTQPSRRVLRGSDLLGFKAHFHDCRLSVGLMPLLAFPGGYGGMVHTNEGRATVSCCIRRDQLERCRRTTPGGSAAETVLAHLRNSCRGAREALAVANLEGPWLSAGPIRPGIRPRFTRGIFCIGNAAGEAHPIIAEGISMAIQSAWLLCERLVARRREGLTDAVLQEVGRDYADAWLHWFAPRIRVASLFAQLAMRPTAVALLLPLLRLFPAALTLGAGWSGKCAEVAPSRKSGGAMD